MEITAASLTFSLSSSITRPTLGVPVSSICGSTFSFFPSNASNSAASALFKKSELGIGRARSRTTTQFRKKGLTCNALFGLGVPELVVIAGVAALVFGPKQLPEVGRNIGKTIKSFQQAAKEFESEIKKEPDSLSEASGEKSTTVNEQEEQDIKVSSSKDSV